MPPNLQDPGEHERVVKEIEKDAERVTARETLAVIVLCSILALVTVYVAITELWEASFYPDEAYFTTTLGGVLPKWAVVGNFMVAALAHAASAMVVYTGYPLRSCVDWLAVSLCFNAAVITVWFIALIECHQCNWFNGLLLLVPNSVSCFMAYDSVKDKATLPSLLINLKVAGGLVKQKTV